MLALIFSIAVALASDDASAIPAVFEPGVISSAAHDSAPAFSPDGRTVLLTRSTNAASIIVESHSVAGRWSMPTIASFSGRWLDMEPAMAPDGSYLIFVSNRPIRDGGNAIDGSNNGVDAPGRGANLWRSDRTAHGWSGPVRMPDTINASTSTYSPSIAANGNLYFMRPDETSKRFRLFEAQKTRDGYATPMPLSFSTGAVTDVDPAVAPDESFMVFGSGRHPHTGIDLFITFQGASGWSEPLYLGDKINSPGSDAEPRLGPDHHTLYFSSDRVLPVPEPIASADAGRVLDDMQWNNGLYNIWSVDITPWLRTNARLRASRTSPEGRPDVALGTPSERCPLRR